MNKRINLIALGILCTVLPAMGNPIMFINETGSEARITIKNTITGAIINSFYLYQMPQSEPSPYCRIIAVPKIPVQITISIIKHTYTTHDRITTFQRQKSITLTAQEIGTFNTLSFDTFRVLLKHDRNGHILTERFYNS